MILIIVLPQEPASSNGDGTICALADYQVLSQNG